jgi:hypothetical protein
MMTNPEQNQHTTRSAGNPCVLANARAHGLRTFPVDRSAKKQASRACGAPVFLNIQVDRYDTFVSPRVLHETRPSPVRHVPSAAHTSRPIHSYAAQPGQRAFLPPVHQPFYVRSAAQSRRKRAAQSLDRSLFSIYPHVRAARSETNQISKSLHPR